MHIAAKVGDLEYIGLSEDSDRCVKQQNFLEEHRNHLQDLVVKLVPYIGLMSDLFVFQRLMLFFGSRDSLLADA